MIITPNSLTLAQLLGSANEQYLVPAYQRRYSWKEAQVGALLDDINLIEGEDRHLFGSIVCLTGNHVAGVNRLELVDGQQRLTTLSILLHCILDRLIHEGELDEAKNVGRLLNARALGKEPVEKILLDSLDRVEFRSLVENSVIEVPENPNLVEAFRICRDWVADGELSDLGSILYRLQNQCIIIRLDVSNAKDAFKLFETINNRGLRLSPTDIIKNFVLGNAARFGEDALVLARTKWAELNKRLDGVNTETFFRHFLMAHFKRRITRSFVVSNFKTLFMNQVVEAKQLPERHWYLSDEDTPDELDDDSVESGESPNPADDEDAENTDYGHRIEFCQFLEHMADCARVYGEIVRGDTCNPQIDRHLRNLKMIKSVQTYGFLMQLRIGKCPDTKFREVLKLTEAFMLRRHTCRLRSNENEAIFARLCGVDYSNPLPEVKFAYREYSPSDERFRDDFAATKFNGGIIDRARYCLEQFEILEHGNHDELFVSGPDAVHIEHIIPQKIKSRKAKDEYGDWPMYLGPNSLDRHAKYVSRIGNLTLFAGSLNIGASNNPYACKKSAYKKSAISLTNALPTQYSTFKYKQVDKRSSLLAEAAVTLWPIP